MCSVKHYFPEELRAEKVGMLRQDGRPAQEMGLRCTGSTFVEVAFQFERLTVFIVSSDKFEGDGSEDVPGEEALDFAERTATARGEHGNAGNLPVGKRLGFLVENLTRSIDGADTVELEAPVVLRAGVST